MEFLKTTHIDFIGKARVLTAVSALLVISSIALLATRGVTYGVEFAGGTQLIVRFAEAPATDRIRAALPSELGAVIQTYDEPETHQVLIRIAETDPDQALEDLDEGATRALEAIAQSYPENPVIEHSSEIVGPVVGAELRRKAIQLTFLALAFQLLYIAVRFKGAVWGSGATIAAIHDVVVTLGLLVLLDYEITLNVIAALLTIVGYSVNDTIVIFDRARENLRQRRRDPLRDVVNESINQTLSRTIITSGTTFFAVLALFLFGGEVLRGFAFTMVVGVIIGTWSTVFVASPTVVWWQERSARSGARRPPAAKAAL
jgi:preprotein translocase subunit SecF